MWHRETYSPGALIRVPLGILISRIPLLSVPVIGKRPVAVATIWDEEDENLNIDLDAHKLQKTHKSTRTVT